MLFMKLGSIEGLVLLAIIGAVFLVGWALGRRQK
jgi:hypothetical protein